jgi:hypothetical protein
MDLTIKHSLDEILFQLALADPPVFPRKVLFWGDGVGGISSYVAGWMAGKGIDVILLDGANRFDPYMASSFARKAMIPPERLLKRIRIARAFTCYQMATLMGERLVSLVHARTVGAIHACTPECGVSAHRHESPLQKPWVILLGPITTFFDEDVPEREVRPLFERSLKKVEEIAMEGIPFFLFQPSAVSKNNPPTPPLVKRGLMDSKRAYLTRRLFQFSNLVWRISLDDQEPKLILEKGLDSVIPVPARCSASARKRENGNPG